MMLKLFFDFFTGYGFSKFIVGVFPSISVAVLALACTSNESGLSCQLDCVFYGYKTIHPQIFSTLDFSTPDFSTSDFSSENSIQPRTFQNSGLKSLESKATKVRTFQPFQP